MAPRVVIVGAGMGGLAAAIDLARAGAEVTVVERAAEAGGKMRQLYVDDAPGADDTAASRARGIDAGPTVFTMRWVFEGLFSDAGADLGTELALIPATILARHAWRQGGTLDLYADIDRSADAIGDFAGAGDARGYREFCARSAEVYRALLDPFMAAQRPSPFELVRRVGWRRLSAMLRTSPLKSMWSALGQHFTDPRLRQLFGRYATYCGSSPMDAPATLMLVAHVEQDGVWQVRGGMIRIARAMRALAESHRARFRFSTHVREIVVERGAVRGVALADGERLDADAVVFNGDVGALARGLLGEGATSGAPGTPRETRSLSAVTWCLDTRTSGFDLAHHNVFFGDDYADEFDAIFRRRTITETPTVYVCAQDRGEGASPSGSDRLLVLINAPPDGDRVVMDAGERVELQRRAFGLAEACGLTVDRSTGAGVITTPAEFEQLFPGTGGALYGRATHGALASFQRPPAASRIEGLYLAGGSAHPGPGIPMSTMSGRLAAARLLADHGLIN